MANEKRLIDAYALERRIVEMLKEPNYQHTLEDWRNGLCMAMEAVNEMPTVYAVEVVHSSWLLNDDGSGTCKHCHRTTKSCWDFDNQMNYCPNCGADMR